MKYQNIAPFQKADYFACYLFFNTLFIRPSIASWDNIEYEI